MIIIQTVVVFWRGGRLGQGIKKLSRVMDMFSVSVEMIITWEYTFVKIHRAVLVRFVRFIVFSLYCTPIKYY